VRLEENIAICVSEDRKKILVSAIGNEETGTLELNKEQALGLANLAETIRQTVRSW
jgi:hypothetical protein